ncbi:MAG: replication-associated recombination protein A [Candidatus Borkfalkiaceae bacterium]|nr:replication-associated recombination protein A [Christensenellaceae bacterium]
MDLFDYSEQKVSAPLAERMRARNLSEFIGQSHLIKENSLLNRAIKLDRLGSCIFWGPPGCGKTTLANVIANGTDGRFEKLNAVSCGVADVKRVIEEAKENAKLYGKKTYLLLDECHRFNKAQSDSLLPAVEKGDIIFIGSTTENPYVSMTPAIVSRCRVFELKRLTEKEIKGALIKALSDKERGLGNYDTEVSDDALNHIANMSAGDLRVAYNALELAVLTTPPDSSGKIVVTLSDAEESIQRKALSYDEDLYYDILSAFCKSLRGSDSDAALYYMQRLVQGGCDPLLIARRVIAHASEDVGMADPMAMVMATNALLAFEKMGLPEGLLPLSQAIIYVCEADKSNSVVLAMNAAKDDAVNRKDDFVPKHLRNAVYASKEDKAISKTYKYPHDYGGYVEQQYLPDGLVGRKYYVPSDNGYEKTVKEIRKRKGKK